MKLLRPLALTATLAALLGAAPTCDNSSFYVYSARIYDPQRDCLSDVEAIDIGQGPDPGLGCAAKCLVAPDPDGGAVVYATTMCGPVPYGVDTSETNPYCPAALAAVGRSDICLPDGGSTDPNEAGAEAGGDAGPDASLEAGADATVDDGGADAAVDSGPPDGGDGGPDGGAD